MKKTSIKVSAFILCVMCASGTALFAQTAKSFASAKPIIVFDLGESDSRYYRIPAITLASDGSLVALADKRGDSSSDLPNIISVVAKRSLDGGLTWSEAVTIAQGDSIAGLTFGDPAVVCDSKSGELIAVFSGDTGFFYSNKAKPTAFYVSKSSDNGITWTAPRSITDMLYQPEWEGAFCASGRLTQTSDGRILFAANTRTSPERKFKDIYEFVCASSDGGDNWEVLNAESRIPSDGLGNESKIVELSDGTLLLSMRNPGNRRFSYSKDRGRTWTQEESVSELIEPDCNGDIIRAKDAGGNEVLLQSIPADPEERRNVSVYVSRDEGKTWSEKYLLTTKDSGYSSLIDLGNGLIGCLYEEGSWDKSIQNPPGYRIVFKTFTLPSL